MLLLFLPNLGMGGGQVAVVTGVGLTASIDAAAALAGGVVLDKAMTASRIVNIPVKGEIDTT